MQRLSHCLTSRLLTTSSTTLSLFWQSLLPLKKVYVFLGAYMLNMHWSTSYLQTKSNKKGTFKKKKKRNKKGKLQTNNTIHLRFSIQLFYISFFLKKKKNYFTLYFICILNFLNFLIVSLSLIAKRSFILFLYAQ